MIDKLRDWINENKITTVLGLATVASAVLFLNLGGCATRDWVTARVPPEIVAATGAPATQSVRQAAEVTLPKWQAHIEGPTRIFVENIERGEQTAFLLDQLIMSGLQAGGAAAQSSLIPLGVPGGIVTGGLAVATSLFLPAPGSASRTRKEKERSFNAGLERAKTLA